MSSPHRTETFFCICSFDEIKIVVGKISADLNQQCAQKGSQRCSGVSFALCEREVTFAKNKIGHSFGTAPAATASRSEAGSDEGDGRGASNAPDTPDLNSDQVAGHGAPSQPLFAADVPRDWTPMGDTGSRMLRHRFGTAGECYVGQLGGAAVDMLPFWYGEIGQDPPDVAAFEALPSVSMLGGDARLMDLMGRHEGMSGPATPDARMLVAVVDSDAGVVFVKCVGPRAEVDAQAAAFTEFCKSLRRTDS